MQPHPIVVDHVSKQFSLQRDRARSVKELFTRRGRDRSANHFWALRDVSLEIPDGSMFALVGHNGSGKSTLLRCIAGIYRPDEGQVKVSGRISTLLELGAGFHPDLSGRENIYLNATILGMTKKEIDRAFDDIVSFAGVEKFIDSPVKVYSSGMYVRLGFSVAVHVHPEILIIDEVIAVGDEQFQRRCFEHLYSLRKQGVTIVVVTHGMGTVETMCDGAAWLDHGELQMVGSGPEVAAAYLQRVNQTEMEEMAERSQEESAAGVSEPGYGREIEIRDVYFTDDRGERVSVAMNGEPLTLNIDYHANRPVEDPVFGYKLFGSNAVHLAGTNTKLAGLETGTVEGDGTVSFRMPELLVMPGEFSVTIGINDKYVQHTFDRRDHQHHIVVRKGDRPIGAGLVDIRGEWSITTHEGSSRPVTT